MEDYAVSVTLRFELVLALELTAPPSFNSYGYQTNTRVKFVVILALADAVIRDVDVKTVSCRLPCLGVARKARADDPTRGTRYSARSTIPTSPTSRIRSPRCPKPNTHPCSQHQYGAQSSRKPWTISRARPPLPKFKIPTRVVMFKPSLASLSHFLSPPFMRFSMVASRA